MKILIKCINAGVNNSQFIGERAYSELSYQTNRGGRFWRYTIWGGVDHRKWEAVLFRIFQSRGGFKHYSAMP